MNNTARRHAQIAVLGVVVVVAALVYWLSDLGFWFSLGIAVVAVVVNAFVLAVEDRSPGGIDAP